MKKKYLQQGWLRYLVVATSLGVLALTLQIGATNFGWTLPFSTESTASAQDIPPAYVASGLDPIFPLECGEDGISMMGGGYGINTNLDYHTENSIAIVEGTAHSAGPALFGYQEYKPGMVRDERYDAAQGIHTPFIITVSETHKGPEQDEWNVSEYGGLVDCFSYRQYADGAMIFDGATGLFFIQTNTFDWTGNRVSMTVAKEGPDWFYYTENSTVTIDQAIESIRTVK